jgi:hypothetical protein
MMNCNLYNKWPINIFAITVGNDALLGQRMLKNVLSLHVIELNESNVFSVYVFERKGERKPFVIDDDLLGCQVQGSFGSPFTFRCILVCEMMGTLLSTILSYQGLLTLRANAAAASAVTYIVNVNHTAVVQQRKRHRSVYDIAHRYS